ncbi:TPA: lichenicidin A2 family type 2 lantibiotic, partial [Bacillus tropicus]|nr:lichenicidin A2 family type 2 lantibiotic [Bacillus tropicus]
MMKEMTNYAGPTFEELTGEEMQAIQGSGDVQA